VSKILDYIPSDHLGFAFYFLEYQFHLKIEVTEEWLIWSGVTRLENRGKGRI